MRGELDYLKVMLYYLKESNYMMILLSLYGTLQMFNEEKVRIQTRDNATVEKYIYPKLIHNYSSHKDTITIEETWKTKG